MNEHINEYRIQIALGIFIGDHAPAPIASAIGSIPNRVATKGSRRNDDKAVIPRQSYVSYRSEASSGWSSSFEEHWQSLKSQLGEKVPVLAEISQNAYMKITFIVDYTDHFPPLYLDLDFIDFAHGIDAIIDVDTYDDREYAEEGAELANRHDYHLNMDLVIDGLADAHNKLVETIIGASEYLDCRPSDQGLTISTKPPNGWDSLYEQHWQCLKEALTPKLHIIKQIIQSGEVSINMTIEDITRFPIIFMEKDFIKFAYDMKARVNISTYE